jgi:hypothetical protein
MRDGSGSCSENAPNQPAYLLIHFVGIGQRSGDFVAEPLPERLAGREVLHCRHLFPSGMG